MNAKQENRFSNVAEVKDVLMNHQTIWQAVVALATAMTELNVRTSNINTLNQARRVSSKGTTELKHNLRTAMEVSTLDVAGGVRAYGSKVGDRVLFASVDYTPSDLRQARDSNVPGLCQGVHDAANAVVANLGDYNVTALKLSGLQANITAYNSMIGKPRAKLIAIRASGKLIDTELGMVKTLLDEQVDGLMEQFKSTEPQFYAEYTAVRGVVDSPATRPKTPANGPTPPQ